VSRDKVAGFKEWLDLWRVKWLKFIQQLLFSTPQ
jgi:hypothetical protein